MRTFRKVTKVLNSIVFYATIVILIFMALFTLPRLFGVKPFVVLSGSMEPTIPTGSLVFVNTKDKDVQVDDIITFSLATGKDSGVYVTHRVHAMDESGLIQTKGDNNRDADGWLNPEAVTGKVLLHIPYLGLVLDFLQGKGFVLVAFWVFLVNVLSMVFTWFVCHGESKKS